MKSFLIALQFLTILPVKIKVGITKKDFGKSLVYFPAVGLVIGLLLILALSIFGSLPSLVVAALILVTSIIITGGLHLDGFADTCDGFYGSNPPEKILEIMKDSRIGAMGVVGIVSLLLIKFTLIASIPKDFLWKALIGMAVFSRWSQVLACSLSKYARKEGKAKYFVESATERDAFITGLLVFGLFLLLLQVKGVAIFFISLFLILSFINWIKLKISGMTGDTIGAINEIAEVLVLLLFLFLSKPNV